MLDSAISEWPLITLPGLALCVAELDPETLTTQATASVAALYAEGQSKNTARSYATALRYWAAWFRLRYGAAIMLPVPTPVVLQFIVDHVERHVGGKSIHDLPAALDAALCEAGFKSKQGAPKLSTVAHRLAVLSKAHMLQELDNPVRAVAVQELMRRIRRGHAQRGETPTAPPALTRDPFSAVLATCGDDLIGTRDRALLLFAWASGGRRRSEVSRAVMANLTRVDATTYLYRLTHSKTDQAGAQNHRDKPIIGPAAAALTAWLTRSRIRDGAIFRRIRGACVAEALEPQAIRYIVKRRAQLAGLTGRFSAHSLRSGFMTEAGRQNVPLAEAMALTGHRSISTAMRYFQTGAVQTARAASLLGDLAPADKSLGPVTPNDD